jgi:hypothetical protein
MQDRLLLRKPVFLLYCDIAHARFRYIGMNEQRVPTPRGPCIRQPTVYRKGMEKGEKQS